MPVDRTLPALALQQPWAELILRGRKTLEVRVMGVRRVGRILLYASKRLSNHPAAREVSRTVDVAGLPTGVVVGSVEVTGSRPAQAGDAGRACVGPEDLEGMMVWELTRPERWEQPVVPEFLPYGVWFYPWGKNSGE